MLLVHWPTLLLVLSVDGGVNSTIKNYSGHSFVETSS